MTMRRYKGYKDSGVEWLGPVPEHWAVTRLKFIAHVQTGVAKGKDNTGRQTITVPYLRVANVQDGYLDLDEVATIEIPADDLPRYRLRVGDVLMNEGGDFDKLGRGHVWDGSIDPCIHQNHVFAVRPFAVSPQWLNLVTGSAYAQFYFMSRSKQSTNLASISSTNVMELPVLLPPAPEQSAIAAFLDREVTKIDTLIAEQQRLIELLTEKRQAVIAQAVTKGLNPSVPMKDSGVDWLGEVPAHWRVKQMKHLIASGTSISYGIVQPGMPLTDGVPFIQTTNMTTGDFSVDCLQRTSTEIAAMYPRTELSGGEVVLGIRASIGASCIVPQHLKGCNLSRGVARIVCSVEVSSGFLVTYLGTGSVARYWQLAKQGSTFNEVSIETVRELRVVVPPRNEQDAIQGFVDIVNRNLGSLTREAECAIDLLKERRTALISAAVTGQIDVRQPSPTQSAPAAHLQPHDEPHGL